MRDAIAPHLPEFRLLEIEERDAIAVVSLNRPPVNAVNQPLYEEIRDLFTHIDKLLPEVRVVVLPASHRLARRKKLRPADLAAETFVVQPGVPQDWRDHWLLVAENGTRPPTSPHTADKLEDWLHLIARGEGIDTAPAVIGRYFAWPEVAYVPLVDAAPSTLAIVRRRDSTDPLVTELVELAVEIAAHAANANTPYSAAEPRGGD
jgi:DNA-binding transcriptional LysR family regulator